ncbi:hypothetical protein [Nocardioides albus]|uniref:Uncharacterized protein n=1 Tax=Nocardioides albus TaxID=1841 RepID=A0A7W5A2M7_9ACTN|nr:hypothetical protein [Nocardioides albus]MBB3088546.1 hypothetical protein [Nocardioides albus]GGU17049.1 hypothetical protein GCM10007979_14360 [Nocardioides albus]
MGIELVTEAVRNWSYLPGNPYKVLVFMAAHTLDAGKMTEHFGWVDRGYYFRGHVALAGAIGYGPKTAPGKKAQEQVRLAVKVLLTEGAIVREVDGKPGQRAEYRLTLEAQPVENTLARHRTIPLETGGTIPLDSGGTEAPDNRGDLYPLEEGDQGGIKDSVEEKPKDPSVDSQTYVQSARAAVDEAKRRWRLDGEAQEVSLG